MSVAKYCIMLPKEIVESPFVEILKPRLGTTLSCNSLCFEQGLHQAISRGAFQHQLFYDSENNTFIVRQLSTYIFSYDPS